MPLNLSARGGLRYVLLTDEVGGGRFESSPPSRLTVLSRRRERRFLLRCWRYLRIASFALVVFNLLVVIISVLLALFFPLYTVPPLHYQALATRIKSSSDGGRGNVNREKVFIAANIISAEMIQGAWGLALRELVDILGPSNVYVSIYENDSGLEIQSALRELERSLQCNTTIKTGQHINLDDIYHVQLSNGERVVKRIEYLAEVRNRALRPLQQSASPYPDSRHELTIPVFDKLLFLNDVYFDPIEATQLLFSTHQNDTGKADYQAACAVDFVSLLNNYDDYATRDLDGNQLGYGPGFRIFPWFAGGASRADVLAGTDAVRVRSCWGGMIAFNAVWFQHRVQGSLPDPIAQDRDEVISFRSEKKLFWDASECCLINADISARYRRKHPHAQHTGVFQNPYIRTAYTLRTFGYLKMIARFEHGFSILQLVLTKLARYPLLSERRLEEEGMRVSRQEWTWQPSGGQYQAVERVAGPGGFCGRREMDFMKENFAKANLGNEKPYVHLQAPSIRYQA